MSFKVKERIKENAKMCEVKKISNGGRKERRKVNKEGREILEEEKYEREEERFTTECTSREGDNED